MSSGQLTVRWKRVTIFVGVGLILAIAIATSVDAWRKRDSWCIRFSPDGAEKTLYGADCNFPNTVKYTQLAHNRFDAIKWD